MEETIIEIDVEQEVIEENKACKTSERFKLIRNGILISGLSVFAQLYLFQPMLGLISKDLKVAPATSSLAVSASTTGMAVGLFILAFKADAIERKKLMSLSLFISSVITLLSAFSWNFTTLVFLNFLKGIVLSGVSAVALAYLTEEVSVVIMGLAISLYLSGNTLGGMSGRIIAILTSGYYGWRSATFAIGILSLLMAVGFSKIFPKSVNFKPGNIHIAQKLTQMKGFMKNTLFIGMFIVGGIVMGVFVSIYNYLNFILEAPPFSLPHYIIALIFLMYTVGIGGSIFSGKWSDRINPSIVLKGLLLSMLLGLFMLQSTQLWIVVFGLGVVTFSFFGTHTMASRIVSEYANEGKSSATCLYWLFYYIGSSVVGYVTGIFLFSFGWNIFMDIIMIMTLIAFFIAIISTRHLVNIHFRFERIQLLLNRRNLK